MAALADRGQTTGDIAHATGLNRSRVWAILNGRQRVTPELRSGLDRLLGSDQAAIVLAGIPDLPRARRPASAAVQALHAAGLRAEDVAALIPVQPGTVRCWLRGTLRPSPKLGAALEQLLDGDQAAQIVALIPDRGPRASPHTAASTDDGVRAPVRS
jgi:transcriptional regulator with XRE-family HTH domain